MTTSNHELSGADGFSVASPTEPKEFSQEMSYEVANTLRRGPRGAMLIAGVAVGMLFLGWLLFYFVLFMRRGYVG